MILVGFLIIWPAITYFVLRSPGVQTFLARSAAAYLSAELETEVSVGGVTVSPRMNVVLEEVLVRDQRKEPMLSARRMVFDIGRFSPQNRFLTINKLSLEEGLVNLAIYPGEEDLNIRFLIDYFTSGETQRSGKRPWDVLCKSLEIGHSGFLLNDQNKARTIHGFDPSHMVFSGLDLLMTDIFLDRGTLSFSLDNLSFFEANGFDLKELSGFLSVGPRQGRIENLLLRSGKSLLSMDLEMNYDGFDAFNNFYDSVDVSFGINNSRLDLADLAHFVPGLYGLQDPVTIRGRLSGKPAELRGTEFYLSYGLHSIFRGNFQVVGLPVFEETFVNFFVEDLRTHVSDIAGFHLPAYSDYDFFQIPDNLYNLGDLSFRGRLSGYPADFSAYGTLRSDLGELTTDLVLKKEAGDLYHAYKGRLYSPGFELGRFFGRTELLGNISLNAEIEGKGVSLETLEMMIDGNISSFELAGYGYENMKISGDLNNRMFNGALMVDDDNVFMDFLGMISFGEEFPVFDFQASVERANLTRLNIYQPDPETESIVSATLTMNAAASSLAGLTGQLDVGDLRYEERLRPEGDEVRITSYSTDLISLSSKVVADNQQELLLVSDFFDAELRGLVSYERIMDGFMGFLASYMPAYFPDHAPWTESNQEAPSQDFTLGIRFKDFGVLSDLFLPWIRFSEGAELELDFNSALNEMMLTGQAGLFTLAGNRFVDWEVDAAQADNAFLLNWYSKQLLFSDSLFIDNVSIQGTLASDALLVDSRWGSDSDAGQNHGHIGIQANFLEEKYAVMHILPSFAMVNDSLWQVNVGNEVILDSARIEVNNLRFYNNQQFILANGVFGPDSSDRMVVDFRDFDFANLALLARTPNMDFAGRINGSLSMTGIYQTPGVEGEIAIRDFAFNNERLGDLTFFTLWDHEAKGFNLAAELVQMDGEEEQQSMVISGYLYPDHPTDNFDLDLRLDGLSLSVWSRYMDNFIPGFRGLASGHLRLEGPFRTPELSGVLQGREGGFEVDYLNTSYSFSHEVELGKDFFRFQELPLFDSQGNRGLASGTITHQNFKNFHVDLVIRPENMLVLNTSASGNELYYGRAFATGLVHIFGPEDNITMDVSARTNRGTEIFLPLSYTGEILENNFITFVSTDTIQSRTSLPEARVAGITMNFDLEVTPEAEVQLIFDSQIGDIIRGRGTGNLMLEINSLGAFNMYGEYQIEEGDYLFTLQNLINKRFRIEQGGLISWTGDPNDADVDIRAMYRLRTALYDLVLDVDTSDAYRRRVPVDCVLILKEKLFNPSISFDIALPTSDESTREMVDRLITTEQEMNRQVFSLLILNRFMPTTTDQYNTALGYGVGSTSSELLSNQLSNWLSQISADFDIGVNYRPGDEISSQELEVALSTQLFDDRVIIDGNVGVAGSHPTSNQRASNIIGDVNVEVKITPEGKFRIKAFNRSNTFDIIHTNAPYTQGVGLFYRKEFDTLMELFSRQQNKPQEAPDPAD